MLLLPEITLSLGIMLLILISSLSKFKHIVGFSVAIMLCTLFAIFIADFGSASQWVIDPLTKFSQSVATVLTIWILGYSYNTLPNEKHIFLCVLLMLALLGIMVTVSATSWLLLYIGLELIALPIYALSVIDKELEYASEAGLKYFVMGVIASILLLYGVSFIYLATSSINYIDIQLIQDPAMFWYLTIGVVFFLTGLFFKLGLAPFHMWVPDIYQNAPISVVYWLATVPKLAYVVMFIRILKLTSIGSIIAVSQIVFMVAVLSVIYGVLMAIKQKSIRRLIAYASIAHMGFVMLPIAISSTAYSYSLIYLTGYILITVVAFAVMVVFSRLGIGSISDIRGLYYKMPYESFAFLLSLAAMAGIPPMVGFITKLNLFYLIIDSGHVVLAAVLAVCVVISAYYYMGLVRAMYFKDSIMVSSTTNYPLAFLSLSLIVLGVIPQVFLIGLNQLV